MKINSIMITLKAWRVRLCADVPSPVQSNCDDDSLRILYVVSYARSCRPIVRHERGVRSRFRECKPVQPRVQPFLRPANNSRNQGAARRQSCRVHCRLTTNRQVTRSEVGFESVSQFNREYSRFFGQPTIREIKALRDGKVAVSTAA